MTAPTFNTTRALTAQQIRALKPGDTVVFNSSPDRYKRAQVVSGERICAGPPHSVTARDSGRRLFYVDVVLLREDVK